MGIVYANNTIEQWNMMLINVVVHVCTKNIHISSRSVLNIFYYCYTFFIRVCPWTWKAWTWNKDGLSNNRIHFNFNNRNTSTTFLIVALGAYIGEPSNFVLWQTCRTCHRQVVDWQTFRLCPLIHSVQTTTSSFASSISAQSWSSSAWIGSPNFFFQILFQL